MDTESITSGILSIIPAAATVAVAGHAFNIFAKPIKKSKDKMGWL